jgi:hypothetical protein
VECCEHAGHALVLMLPKPAPIRRHETAGGAAHRLQLERVGGEAAAFAMPMPERMRSWANSRSNSEIPTSIVAIIRLERHPRQCNN